VSGSGAPTPGGQGTGSAGGLPEQLEGVLRVRVVDAGSKAAMPAAVLETGDQAVVLRRRGAVRLDAEPELTAYEGKRVRVVGTRSWRTFVVDSVEPLEG
jgi:hypothetical protein